MPLPLQVDLWPTDLESDVRVTCDMGYLCANFGLPRPLSSRFRPDVCDRETDVRCASSLNAPATEVGYSNSSTSPGFRKLHAWRVKIIKRKKNKMCMLFCSEKIHSANDIQQHQSLTHLTPFQRHRLRFLLLHQQAELNNCTRVTFYAFYFKTGNSWLQYHVSMHNNISGVNKKPMAVTTRAKEAFKKLHECLTMLTHIHTHTLI